MTKKLYIDNPYLKEVFANVVDKTLKNDKFHIKLDKTIFFPYTYNNIPNNLGTLDDKIVIDVYEDENDIIHVIESDIEETEISLKINWENRYDLMQQHTGLFILSATFKSLFNTITTDFQINKDYSTIDLELPNISDDEIYQIEILSNKIVQANFKITNTFFKINDNIELNFLKPIAEKKGARIINMNNIGAFPYYYAHVNNTGEVGLIKILKSTSYDDNTRINFICGNRALEDYITKNKLLNNISTTLSSNIPNVLNEVLKLKTKVSSLKNISE